MLGVLDFRNLFAPSIDYNVLVFRDNFGVFNFHDLIIARRAPQMPNFRSLCGYPRVNGDIFFGLTLILGRIFIL